MLNNHINYEFIYTKKKKKTKDFHEYNIICMSYINMSLLMEQIYLIFF